MMDPEKLIHKDTIEAEAHLPRVTYLLASAVPLEEQQSQFHMVGFLGRNIGSVMKYPEDLDPLKIPVERQSLMDPRPRQIMSTTDMKYFLLFKI
jgi:hypothetical protein